MRSFGIATLAAVALLAASTPLRSAPKEDPLAVQVNTAIKQGVQFLRDEGPKGEWEKSITATTAYPGGMSALAMLALLTAGVSADDPLIQKGLTNLRERNRKSKDKDKKTYVV